VTSHHAVPVGGLAVKPGARGSPRARSSRWRALSTHGSGTIRVTELSIGAFRALEILMKRIILLLALRRLAYFPFPLRFCRRPPARLRGTATLRRRQPREDPSYRASSSQSWGVCVGAEAKQRCGTDTVVLINPRPHIYHVVGSRTTERQAGRVYVQTEAERAGTALRRMRREKPGWSNGRFQRPAI